MKLSKITVKANAKINLALDITGKRADGYHFIDTVMQSVTLSDTVFIQKSNAISLECSVPHLSGEENLGLKAARLFFEKTKIFGGAEIYIEKAIPEAGGMGGGSADAAAVLLGLDKLYETKLPFEELAEIALKLGADVPFFLNGGTVRCTGIGEKMQKITPLKKGWFVIAKEGEKPSTGEMYRRIDGSPARKINVDRLVECIEKEDLKKPGLNFQNAFLSVWGNPPLIGKLKSFSPLGVGLSGSGPTCFAYFEAEEQALGCKKQLCKEGICAFVAEPAEKAIEFQSCE